MHKAGFINLIGLPNAGKSTLMNQLVGEQLSIITAKAQTTRHRIIGIINDPDHQLVFSDTPGILEPGYKMQEAMMKFVQTALNDADVLIFLVDGTNKGAVPDEVLEKLKKAQAKLLVAINKVDLMDQAGLENAVLAQQQMFPEAVIIPVSARENFGTDVLMQKIKSMLPEAPPFYDKDQLTDKPEKFFVSEIIREKILIHYEKEIPYSCEVAITSFKESTDLVKIAAEIYVIRESQKAIVIGKGGLALKKVATAARKDIEKFLGRKVFLEIFVKVKKDWRNDERLLRHFGYET